MSTLLSIVALMLGWFPCDQTRSLTPQTYCTRVLPIGIALGLCLTTGNVAYLYNSVAFIQILKAFAPVVLLLVLFAARLDKPSATLIASIMIISGGTAGAAGRAPGRPPAVAWAAATRRAASRVDEGAALAASTVR